MENDLNRQAPVTGTGEFMTRVMDCLPAGILLIRADRTIAYANDMFMRLWRVPDDLVKYRNDFALMNHVLNQVADAMSFIKVVEGLYASMDTSDDEVVFKDGRVFWRRSYPVLEDDGKVARVWVFIDTSDVRQALIETIKAASQTIKAQDMDGQTAEAGAPDTTQTSWFDRKKRQLLDGLKL